jgi:hypothetical protein
MTLRRKRLTDSGIVPLLLRALAPSPDAPVQASGARSIGGGFLGRTR